MRSLHYAPPPQPPVLILPKVGEITNNVVWTGGYNTIKVNLKLIVQWAKIQYNV